MHFNLLYKTLLFFHNIFGSAIQISLIGRDLWKPQYRQCPHENIHTTLGLPSKIIERGTEVDYTHFNQMNTKPLLSARTDTSTTANMTDWRLAV